MYLKKEEADRMLCMYLCVWNGCLYVSLKRRCVCACSGHMCVSVCVFICARVYTISMYIHLHTHSGPTCDTEMFCHSSMLEVQKKQW